MPKVRQLRSKGQKAVPKHIPFKLGGRKGTTSALMLSTEDLLKRYEKGGKDVTKIVQVLAMRGIANAKKVVEDAKAAAAKEAEAAEA